MAIDFTLSTFYPLSPSRRLHQISKFIFILTLLCAFTGCDRYWWTRGQPPSSAELLSKAAAGFEEQRVAAQIQRKDIVHLTAELRDHLLSATNKISRGETTEPILSDLDGADRMFNELQHRVSIGSRAPLAELSGQLRVVQERARKGEPIRGSVFGVLAARTLFLLTNELTVPPPAVG